MAGRLHQGSSSNTLVQHSTAETAITRNTTVGSVSMSAAPKEVPQRDDTLATDGPGVLYENSTSRPTTHSPPRQIEEGLTEKSNEAALTQATLPWCRQDGWSGWGRESVSTKSLVPSLVVQALSAGVLDAVTYAEFNTFASNRASRGSQSCGHRLMCRNWKYNSVDRRGSRQCGGRVASHRRLARLVLAWCADFRPPGPFHG